MTLTDRLNMIIFILLLSCTLFASGAGYAWTTSLPVQRIEKSPYSDVKLSGINEILQDSQGFMWLATETGLLRYDGLNTVKYESHKHNPNSLSSQYCRSLIEDRKGKIWVATENGLNEFDPLKKSFTRYLSSSQPDSLSHNFTTKVIEASSGDLFVATAGGLTRISADRSQIEAYRLGQENSFLLSNMVRTVMEDSSGYIWVGYEDMGASRWHPKTGEVRHFHALSSPEYQPGELGLIHHDVREIAEDVHGQFWFGTFGGGVSRVNFAANTVDHFAPSKNPNDLPSGVIWDLFSDREGKIWITMDKGGVAVYDDVQGVFKQYRHDPFNPRSLLSDTVKDVYQDSRGNYWFATFPGGLSRYHPQADQFQIWLHQINDPNSLDSSAIIAIARSQDGVIWVGTEKGLNTIDETTGKVTHFVHDPDNPKSIPDAAVLSVVEAPSGDIWLGTWGQGLSRLDRKTGEFDHFSVGNGPHQVRSPYVWKVFFDSQTRLWLATETDGLNLYDPKSDKFERYTHSASDGNSISFNYVWDIEESRSGHLWIGTQHGLNLFDPDKHQFRRFAEMDHFQGLGNARIHSVLEDQQGFVWVATQSSGLKRWDPQTETIVSLTIESGLPSNTVSSIQQDNQGFIWVSTVEGIAKIDPEQLSVLLILNQYTGIAGDNHNRNASLKGPDGALYFGGTEGLTKFYPAQIQTDPYEPKVTLTDIYVLNKPANYGEVNSPLTQDISQSKEVVLGYDDNMVSLEFSSLDFGHAGKLRFAYWLEGFDTDWNIVQNHNRATYTNLDPGRYTFKVRRQLANGDWSKNITELSIVVQSPPWLSPMAYGFYLLLVLGFFYLISRLILLRVMTARLNEEVRRRTDELSRANNAKTQFLANMSHELRTPLNSVIGFSKRLMAKYEKDLDQQGIHALDAIYRNGQHLLSLINDILDLSKIESGKMELSFSPCNLSDIINGCISDLQEAFTSKGLTVVPPNSYPIQVIRADAQRLAQILYNLLSNAIKYTDEGHVAIVVDDQTIDEKRYCSISVIDTGKGIRKEDQEKLFKRFEQMDEETRHIKGFGTGLGLALVSEFAALHGGYVNCQSIYGEGSQFTVFLPLPTLN